ncbi:MAG: two-component sensor histidine kinase [Hyphomicrobiaceae bacterium]|nr:two-component sensor histidine kinase [Hyphomicrobiaceae bacterium]
MAGMNQVIDPKDKDLNSEAGTGAAAAGAVDWKAMLEAMPDAAVVLDGMGRAIHVNTLFADTYPEVRLGHPLSRWLRHPELIQAIDLAVTSDQPKVVSLIERLPLERRVSARAIRLRPGPIENLPTGGPTLLVTFRDLSERDRLAQMREDFIANASHELRTPLASLKGFIETLQGAARDDAAARQKFLGLMAGQAERMSRLIDDLLSLSRIEMREHVPPRSPVDLDEVAAYVLQTLQPIASAANVSLRLEPSGQAVRIRGERDELVQLVTNLVQNAITHGGANGEVRVGVNRIEAAGWRGPRGIISVADKGPGIAREHLPRLTERFYRASVSSSRSKGGTGLGLAIVKHIVARHRGDLEVSSDLGKGTTFRVLFDAIK